MLAADAAAAAAGCRGNGMNETTVESKTNNNKDDNESLSSEATPLSTALNDDRRHTVDRSKQLKGQLVVSHFQPSAPDLADGRPGAQSTSRLLDGRL